MAAASATVKEAAPAAAIPSAPAKQPVIGRADFKLFEFCNSIWSIVLPEGVTKETLLDAALWSMAPEGMQPFDIIRAVAADWWAEILVRQCVRARPLQLVLLRLVDLPAMMQDQTDRVPPGFTIERTPQHGWTIVRLADGVRMLNGNDHGGIHTREDALRWLLDHASLRTGVRT